MFKKIIFSFFSLSLIFTPFFSWADNNLTIEYLQNLPQNSWITQSLAAANLDNLDLSYLDASTQDLLTASKYLLTLAAVESDDWEQINYLVNIVNNNFNNGQLGSPDLLNDDFWGILALSAVGSDQNIEAIKNFILSHQNADGGWSWGIGQTSDTNDTAAAIMSLAEAGLDQNSSAINNAINYLHSAQQSDGGFAYDLSSQSDGASTAWVIAALNKLNINSDTWLVAENTPLSFLASLEQADGSFLWLPEDTQSSNLVTAYALLAQLGSSYPVHKIAPAEEINDGGVSLRIEGPEQSICLAENLNGATVLEVLIQGAELCDFSYQVTETEYGPYVSSIAGIEAQGLSGWQYWQNWQAGSQSANVQSVVAGDQLLWAYGPFDILPSKLTASLDENNNVSVHAQYYQEDAWHDLSNQAIKIGAQTFETDASGNFSTILNDNGIYPVYVLQSDDYIRSPKVYLTVGDGISQELDLNVEIINDDGGNGGDQVSFLVSQSNINFGQLAPGQIGETILQIQNTGNVAIHLEANVLGSDVFSQYTSLDNLNWLDWQNDLASQVIDPVNVKLSLPNSLLSSGNQSGQLIFWAQAQ
ncbi:DUF4430 domain-containing protein [Candidatus Nomurabacteria bacterium]|nr:DUF4430 domain-containing protein [Candidatus Nomurabacteria bacterium]